MRKEFYEQIWYILVEYAGANKGDKELFVLAFNKAPPQVVEYRFGGHLGFGGKFWHYDRSPYSKVPFYVTYYPEDHDPKRDKIVENVNMIVAAIWNAEVQK